MSLEKVLGRADASFFGGVRNFLARRTLGYGLALSLTALTPMMSCGSGEEGPVAGCSSDEDCKNDRVCTGGKCVQEEVNNCTPHTGKTCYDGNVYWTNSCGNIEELAEECSARQVCENGTCVCPSHASKTCFREDVYWVNSCGDREEMAEDCQTGKHCENGTCACTPHFSKICYDGDAYWQNGCGNREEIAEDCSTGEHCIEETQGATCCTVRASRICDRGDAYWEDSCGNKGEMAEDCSTGQHCESGVCVCTPHQTRTCVSNDVHWQDSCGSIEELVEECSPDYQICEDGSCNDKIPPGRIAFIHNRGHMGHIDITNPNGSNRIHLENFSFNGGSVDWSPDGTQFIFYDATAYQEADLWIMNVDGSNPHRITSTSWMEGYPQWSPDGQKIVFESYQFDDAEIYIMNVNGSNTLNLTNNRTREDLHPAWSPDGTKIAFHSCVMTYNGYLRDCHIYVMNGNGSNLQQLTFSVDDVNPAWSPDGSKISFCRTGSNNDVYVMDANGGNVRQLTSEYTIIDHTTTWSPDGLFIALDNSVNFNPYISVMRADGSGTVDITEDYEEAPDWSPH